MLALLVTIKHTSSPVDRNRNGKLPCQISGIVADDRGFCSVGKVLFRQGNSFPLQPYQICHDRLQSWSVLMAALWGGEAFKISRLELPVSSPG